MENRLYVGNLSYTIDRAALEAMFTEFGEVVKADLITEQDPRSQNPDDRRSKGFGFVEMATAEAAQAAIAALDGKEDNGRPLKVNVARPKEDRPRNNFGGGNGGGGNRNSWGGNGYQDRN